MTHTNKPLGRPRLATGRKDAVAYIRLTVEQKKRLGELGGAKWVRDCIDRDKEHNGGRKPRATGGK